MKRAIFLGEALAIAAAILLGALWPSIYTIVALVVFLALPVALTGCYQPRLLEGSSRRNVVERISM